MTTPTPRHGVRFEDIAVGDVLTPHTHGPLTPVHLMRFSAAIENWHRIHYDERFAREHDGLPGLLASGSWKQHLVAQMVRAWAGPDARLERLSLQFRAMNVVGEALTAWGNVTGVDAEETYGLVTCNVGIRNQRGEESSPGLAVVALPYRDGPPLPISRSER